MDAKQGGCGFLYSKIHTVAPSPRTALGEALWETGRWQSVAIKINASGLIIDVVTIYGLPRANEGGDSMDMNEDFMVSVFDEARSLGAVPVLVLGLLAALTTTGQWAGKRPDECDLAE